MSTKLSEILGMFMAREDRSVGRLAALSGVPKKTITNWLSGDVRKPHQWQPLFKVASVLHLNREETEELIRSAGYPPLAQIYSACAPADRLLFSSWQDTISGNTSLKKRPFQVQDDLASFVGRHEEIEQLKSIILQQRRAAICGLRGMGGVGKSTLATHLAHFLKEEFSDGVLWARLDVSDTLTILQSFAQAFDMDVSHFRDVESRAASVRSLLADKSLLIILDNAENSHQVRPLIPPNTENCAVLVTTRNDLSAIDGWNQVVVGPFKKEEGEALQLFEKQLGSEFVQRHHDHLTEIADLVGHLPLAISIIGGQLKVTLQMREDHDQTESDTLLELFHGIKDEASRLKVLDRDDQNIKLSFNLSFYSLPEELQEFFPQLGVFGGEDFNREAIAWVTGNDLAWTSHTVDALIERSLVESSRPGRFRLHPLLRDYARALLKSTDATVVVKPYARMIQYYTEYTERNTYEHLNLQNEISNIFAAFDAALTYSQLELLIRLTNSAGQFLEMRGLYTVAENHMKRAYDAAVAMEDKIATANVLFYQAMMLMRRSKYAEAEKIFQQSLQIAEEQELHELAIRITKNLCAVCDSLGEFEQMDVYAHQAHSRAEKLGNERLLSETNIALGAFYANQGDRLTGERLTQIGLSLANKTEHWGMVALACLNLGGISEGNGDIENARNFWSTGIELTRRLGYKERLSGMLGSLGNIEVSAGNYQDALPLLQEGLDVAHSIGHHWLASVNLEFMGRLHLAQQNLSAANNVLNESLTIARNIGAHRLIAQTLFTLAQVKLASGSKTEAMSLGNESLSLFQSVRHAHTDDVQQWLDKLQ